MKLLNSILLVDDDIATNTLNSFVIKKAQISKQIKVVLNGFEALNYLDQIEAEDELPEFIFLDINMPKMDGWEFLEEYRARKKYHSKIFLLTTSENPDDMIKSKLYPEILEYCHKPLTTEILLQLWEKYNENEV
ncbi:MAG: response regulator [Bacteroidia bacterium]